MICLVLRQPTKVVIRSYPLRKVRRNVTIEKVLN